VTPAEVLGKAADLIEERGYWFDLVPPDAAWPSSFELGGGPLPVGHAIYVAGTKEESAVAHRELSRIVGNMPFSSMHGFEVVAKLREVADDLRRAS
jgi:hypothetical protein